MADLPTIAEEVSTGTELMSAIFPFFGSFIGPAGPAVVAGVESLLKVINDGAQTIAASKPGATWQEIIQELVSHNTPGQPNSTALT